MLYKHILLKPAERATDLYQTQMSLKEPPAWHKLFLNKVCMCGLDEETECETHVPVSARIMAGNSQNFGFWFEFLLSLAIQSSESLIFCCLNCFVSCHSVSAKSLKGAALYFYLDSLFFPQQALLQLYLRCQTTITTVSWGLTGATFPRVWEGCAFTKIALCNSKIRLACWAF